MQSHILFKALPGVVALSVLGFLPLQLNRTFLLLDEICDNALDDDGDGLIDLHDPDCECEIVEPVSLIPNPSFEDMNCCPSSQSQLDCATGWIQASEPTTDFLHICDWMGWEDFPPPLPFPDGDGIMGFRDGRILGETSEADYNWKEYAGACLLSPLLADTPYVFEFHVGFVDRLRSPGINITFFGTTDCANLPFGVGNDEFGCPTNGPGWVRLGSTFVSGPSGNRWVKATIEATPEENITAIVIGPDCPLVLNPVSTYYFFDNLTLVDLRTFQFQITTESSPCAEDFLLRVPEQTAFYYQWYKDGIALVGEISAQLENLYGEGEYRVRVSNGGSCALSGPYNYIIPFTTAQATETICEGDVYAFGNHMLSEEGQYVDTFKTIDHCDSIVFLDLNILGIEADTVQVKIFEGETHRIGKYKFNKEGAYPVELVSAQGCDSLVFLELAYYHIYIPNVFSPNDDGINDLFSIQGGRELIDTYRFTVYDRWGNQVFTGQEWNGKHHASFVNPGVYSYVLSIKMDDGIERQITGNVTLIR